VGLCASECVRGVSLVYMAGSSIEGASLNCGIRKPNLIRLFSLLISLSCFASKLHKPSPAFIPASAITLQQLVALVARATTEDRAIHLIDFNRDLQLQLYAAMQGNPTIEHRDQILASPTTTRITRKASDRDAKLRSCCPNDSSIRRLQGSSSPRGQTDRAPIASPQGLRSSSPSSPKIKL
jgi:hypothetical protein